jgi:hypothetical protein
VATLTPNTAIEYIEALHFAKESLGKGMRDALSIIRERGKQDHSRRDKYVDNNNFKVEVQEL